MLRRLLDQVRSLPFASPSAFVNTHNRSTDWLRLLGVFAAVYVAFGVVAYGPLLEES